MTADQREYFAETRAAQQKFVSEQMKDAQQQNRGIVRTVSQKDVRILREQYFVLKALAARLDAGHGTERDRAMFEAGLREYNLRYDAIRSKGTKASSDR